MVLSLKVVIWPEFACEVVVKGYLNRENPSAFLISFR